MTNPIKKRVRLRVLRILLNQPLDKLTAGEVAASMGMSTSTLRRRLQAENTSYRQLLADVRCYRCEQLFSRQRAGGKRLAAELGFRQPNSFYRAFSRWTGVPWRQYKRNTRVARIVQPA